MVRSHQNVNCQDSSDQSVDSLGPHVMFDPAFPRSIQARMLRKAGGLAGEFAALRLWQYALESGCEDGIIEVDAETLPMFCEMEDPTLPWDAIWEAITDPKYGLLIHQNDCRWMIRGWKKVPGGVEVDYAA